ncbi:hypothetical protein GCM10025876_02370 [Demequina litorisediminis]|uniref:FAD/NAD(P)-binding domain-containing protein n=1 Tax=Demequina litorisediminis TaxID=1849022 RepID=A0ABQ6IAE1_9MICO|nr:hypothetical protein GCM10025876_02370 [Demequina litorisediminis]
MSLDVVPASAIILGGGVIGVEFASVWNSFGSDVTIVEGLPHLVPNEDEALSKGLERAFRKRKINFKVGVFFESVEQSDTGVTVKAADGTVLEAEILLVAVGRGPRTTGLGYEEQGIRMDRGFVLTDEKPHTGVGNIYAVGDIVPGLQARPPRIRPGHLRRRDHRRHEPPADRRVRHPARHLLRPRGRLGRPHGGQGQGDARRRRDRDHRVQPRRQRQEPDPRHAGLREGSCASRRAPWSAFTCSVPAWASRSVKRS